MEDNPLFIEMEANVSGNDYVVMDLHGCYDELMKLLDFVRFDKEKDRLFCGGDLIHRGPYSEKCLQLLKERNQKGQKWFFSVLGNHDEYSAQKQFEQTKGYLDLKPYQKEILELPYLYIVKHAVFQHFLIVHAELNYSELLSDYQFGQDFSHSLNTLIRNHSFFMNKTQKRSLLWSRKIFSYFNRLHQDKIQMGDFSFMRQNKKITNQIKIFSGHNIVPFPMLIGHQMYCDTGAYLGYFNDKINLFPQWGNDFFGLSMIDVHTGRVFVCMSSEQSFGNMPEYHDLRRGDILVMNETLYDVV